MPLEKHIEKLNQMEHKKRYFEVALLEQGYFFDEIKLLSFPEDVKQLIQALLINHPELIESEHFNQLIDLQENERFTIGVLFMELYLGVKLDLQKYQLAYKKEHLYEWLLFSQAVNSDLNSDMGDVFDKRFEAVEINIYLAYTKILYDLFQDQEIIAKVFDMYKREDFFEHETFFDYLMIYILANRESLSVKEIKQIFDLNSTEFDLFVYRKIKQSSVDTFKVADMPKEYIKALFKNESIQALANQADAKAKDIILWIYLVDVKHPKSEAYFISSLLEISKAFLARKYLPLLTIFTKSESLEIFTMLKNAIIKGDYNYDFLGFVVLFTELLQSDFLKLSTEVQQDICDSYTSFMNYVEKKYTSNSQSTEII